MGMGFRRIALAQGLLDVATDRGAAVQSGPVQRYGVGAPAIAGADDDELLQCSEAESSNLRLLRH